MAAPTHTEQSVSTAQRALAATALAIGAVVGFLTISALAVSGPEYGAPSAKQTAGSSYQSQLTTAQHSITDGFGGRAAES